MNGPSLPPTNEVWGKVMFLHLSVCSQGEGGLHRGGGCLTPLLPPELEKRAVRILLECILVGFVLTSLSFTVFPFQLYTTATCGWLPSVVPSVPVVSVPARLAPSSCLTPKFHILNLLPPTTRNREKNFAM